MDTYSLNGITVTTFLDNRRSNKTGKYPVKIRVTYKRVRKYYSTGKDLTLEDWDKLFKAKSPQLIEIRKDLQLSFDKVKECIQLIEENKGFSFDELNVQLGKGVTDTIVCAFNNKIESLKNEDRIGSKIFYECALKNILKFGGEKIEYASITVDWLKRYEKFMLDNGKSYTTIGMYLRALRAIINDAIKSGIIKSNLYPFGKDKYEIPIGEGRKLALTIKQIKDVVTYTDGLEATEHYRDLWFFSYLCNGVNIIDMIQLKFKDLSNGELSFYRSKTIRTSKKKSKIQVIVTPEMKQIIDKWGNSEKSLNNYIFPFLKGSENAEDIKRITMDVTKRINLRMKNISERLNLPHISTYTARHSFATVLKRSGANIAYISESLGHSDLKTTENYLASFEKEERIKNAAFLTNFGEY